MVPSGLFSKRLWGHELQAFSGSFVLSQNTRSAAAAPGLTRLQHDTVAEGGQGLSDSVDGPLTLMNGNACTASSSPESSASTSGIARTLDDPAVDAVLAREASEEVADETG